jgi:alkylation response protein AidB-like acyl-CoA dehydrogenase
MHFERSDDQRRIQRAARELLEGRGALKRAGESGGHDAEMWDELAALGWPGIAVPERYGGQGLGTIELATLLEEHGYACAATPLLGTTLAALAIDHAGTPEQCRRWLPALTTGAAIGGFGTDGLLVDGAVADVAVALDQTTGTARLLAPPTVQRIELVDETRRYARLAPEASGEPLPGDFAGVFDRALILVAAELIGLSRRALALSLDHVKGRRQFGVAIGSFQSVKHILATMLREIEVADASVLYAGYVADTEAGELTAAAACAKISAARAAIEVTSAAIQLHGALGFTWQADVHWLYKRAWVGAQLLGGARAHRARLARLIIHARQGVPAR